MCASGRRSQHLLRTRRGLPADAWSRSGTRTRDVIGGTRGVLPVAYERCLAALPRTSPAEPRAHSARRARRGSGAQSGARVGDAERGPGRGRRARAGSVTQSLRRVAGELASALGRHAGRLPSSPQDTLVSAQRNQQVLHTRRPGPGGTLGVPCEALVPRGTRPSPRGTRPSPRGVLAGPCGARVTPGSGRYAGTR